MEQKKEEKRSFGEWVRKFATCQGDQKHVIGKWHMQDIKDFQEAQRAANKRVSEARKDQICVFLGEATKLVKSGDPELAEMGRKWVKELIWGVQEKVEVKPGDAELVVKVDIDGDKVVAMMEDAIRQGKFGR